MELYVVPDNRRACVVYLRTAKPRLGPSDARAALRIAAGLGASGVVAELEFDQVDARWYRVTPRSARKLGR